MDVSTIEKFNSVLNNAAINLDGVYFVGDPHGRVDHVVDTLRGFNADAVVFLGDFFDRGSCTSKIEELRDLFYELGSNDIQVRYILGNHDHPNIEALNFFDIEFSHLNLNSRVAVLGRNGLKVGGLGGVFRGKVWYPKERMSEPSYFSADHLLSETPRNERILGGLPLRHRSTIMHNDFLALCKQQADVLVSHEAPRYFEDGFFALDFLANKMGASLLVHGHHHVNMCRVSSDGRFAVRSLGVAQVWNWHTSSERLELELDFAFHSSKRDN